MRASIVIPHFNMPSELASCLKSLEAQTVDRSDYEIIVVDNGSDIFIPNDVKAKVDQWLTYTEAKDPYNCRNHGIKAAKGSIIALLDAACIPHKGWLHSAIKRFDDSTSLSILAGSFTALVDNDDPHQVYYKLNHLNSQKLVEEKAGLLTGNLFVRKKVFKTIGLFPENKRSGGDIIWAQEAIANGIAIKYEEEARVDYPAKDKEAILRNALRDGLGAYSTFKEGGKGIFFHLKMIIYHLLPDKVSRIRKKIAYQDEAAIFERKLGQIWWITWVVNLRFAYGYFRGFFV